MLTVDTIGKVRRAHFVQGKKIKAIAREMNLARNTVRDIIRAEAKTEHCYVRKDQPLPQLGDHVAALDAMLKANRRLCALTDLLRLEASHVITGRRIRRAAKELGKALNVADIIVLRLVAEVAVRHVLQHAAAQIADGLLDQRVCHRGVPEVGVT